VGVLFSLYMLFLRGLPGGMAYYLSMYLVSPIIAFQEFYFQQVSNSASSHVFWFFERLMGLLTGGVSMSLHKEFVWVGLPTNVYTAFSDYVY
ncbi:oligosaccharide repeat unit polymerase, partial [Klebsiella quasipneumoniae]|nr:oligosaccharide repeat unit polymerase [Klebsiella quasipneumoniae]